MDTKDKMVKGTIFSDYVRMIKSIYVIASAVAGFLWVVFGASFTFYAGAAFAALALMGLLLKKSLRTGRASSSSGRL